jgi:hypothetical protein
MFVSLFVSAEEKPDKKMIHSRDSKIPHAGQGHFWAEFAQRKTCTESVPCVEPPRLAWRLQNGCLWLNPHHTVIVSKFHYLAYDD